MARRRMRIVHVSPFAPDVAAEHAGGQFFHHYLVAMADEVESSVVVPDRLDNDVPAPRLPPGVEVHRLPVADLARRVHRKRMAVRGAVTGFPLEPGFVRSFRSSSAVAARLREADAVELQWDQLLPMLRPVRRSGFAGPVGVFAHDLLFQSSARRAAASHGVERLTSQLSAGVARRREPRALRRASVVMTFSEADAVALRGVGVPAPIVVGPWLDHPAEAIRPAHEPVALFVGAFWRWENARSAAWLLDDVWPRVVSALPDARLVIAGARPPADLVIRAGDAVEVLGYVDDLQAVYRRARCVVAPLVAGAGLTFKVAQALAYGLPVVTTTIGAEGIVDATGSDAFAAITDDAATFAAACVAVLEPGDRAARIGATAASSVRSLSLESAIHSVIARYRELT